MSEMTSFYGGREGSKFVIVKRYDGVDIPQPNTSGVYTFTGNYYAIESTSTVDNPVFIVPLIVKTESNASNYAWAYHTHNGSIVNGANVGNVSFDRILASGMMQDLNESIISNSDVNYGEYVLIDTIVNCHDFNNLDNGKVYRRGLTGPEYVGQIVGPQGEIKTAPITFNTEVNVKNNAAFESTTQFDTVAGYNGTTYNDKVSLSWANIKDAAGNISSALVGMTFVAPSFSFVAEQVDDMSPALITRVDDETHPFYSEWKIEVPKGYKGDSVKELYIEKDASDNAYLMNKIEKHTKDGVVIQSNTISPYKTIEDVDLSNDGVFSVKYSYGATSAEKNKVLQNNIKWVNDTDGIELKDDGSVVIHYNTGVDQSYPNILTWIKSLTVSDNGSLSIVYNNDNITDNGSNTQVFNLNWIKDAQVENDGTIKFIRADGTVASSRDKYLKSISSVRINDDQKIAIKYNTSDTEVAIGNPINYIQEYKVTPEVPGTSDGNHLLVWFSDPEARKNGIFYDGKTGWIDLGRFKGDNGIDGQDGEDGADGTSMTILTHFASTTSLYVHNDDDGTDTPIKPEYMTGELVETDHGCLVTIGTNHDLYAYDYINDDWYKIGTYELNTVAIQKIQDAEDNLTTYIADAKTDALDSFNTATSTSTTQALADIDAKVVTGKNELETATNTSITSVENAAAGQISTMETKVNAAATSATNAATSKSGADASALKAEGYALGTQNGVATTSGTYFENNAKYWAEESAKYSTLTKADANHLGIVKPDNDTITIDNDGTLHGAQGFSILIQETAPTDPAKNNMYIDPTTSIMYYYNTTSSQWKPIVGSGLIVGEPSNAAIGSMWLDTTTE